MPASKSALSVCCCLLLCAVAGAQITITENDISTTIGDSVQFKVLVTGSTTVDVGSSGGPHVWTFDTAAFSGMVVVNELVDKAASPLGARTPVLTCRAQSPGSLLSSPEPGAPSSPARAPSPEPRAPFI